MGNKQGGLSEKEAKDLASKTKCMSRKLHFIDSSCRASSTRSVLLLSSPFLSTDPILYCSCHRLSSPIVSADELKSLQKGFKEVDKDKSGDLDLGEFKTLMKKEMKTAMSDDSISVRIKRE